MRPLHVCHVLLSLDPGGLENGVVNVVNGLNPAEFRSSICCLQRRGEFAARIRPGVEIAAMGLQPGYDLRLPLRMARLFRAWGVDVVHTRNAEPFFYGLPSARLGGVPAVVHSEHGRTFPEKPLRALAQRWLLRKTDAAFAVSEQLKADLVRELHLPSDRIDVVYNGVDLATFRPRLDEAPTSDSASRTLRIGSVGRLVPVKNYQLLLHALALIGEERPVSLVLVGDGPERTALERLASRLGIQSRVEFAGHRNDVPEVLRGLDVFVLPSLSEGMSNTLLEAMAAGLPVLASDVGGNREVIEAERSGLLFPCGDMNAAAAQLRRLVGSAELRRSLGQSAAARARGQFGIEAMIARYEALYRRVWGEKLGEPATQAAH